MLEPLPQGMQDRRVSSAESEAQQCHITPVLSEYALASCSPQNKFQHCYYHFQGSPVPAAIISRRPYSTVCANTITAISSSLSLCVPTRKTEMAKSKSFSSVASSVWNKLPGHLSSIFHSSCFQEETQAPSFSECLSR